MPVGKVVAFDPDRGRGEVRVDDCELGFHATRIADGSRTITVGTEVAFDVVPGHVGRWEAVNLRPVGTPPLDR